MTHIAMGHAHTVWVWERTMYQFWAYQHNYVYVHVGAGYTFTCTYCNHRQNMHMGIVVSHARPPSWVLAGSGRVARSRIGTVIVWHRTCGCGMQATLSPAHNQSQEEHGDAWELVVSLARPLHATGGV